MVFYTNYLTEACYSSCLTLWSVFAKHEPPGQMIWPPVKCKDANAEKLIALVVEYRNSTSAEKLEVSWPIYPLIKSHPSISYTQDIGYTGWSQGFPAADRTVLSGSMQCSALVVAVPW